MKKIYFLAIALIAFSANAQYEIDFEDFSIGPVSPQSPFIEVWPGGTDCNAVIDEAFSGSLSMNVSNNNTDDVLFLLGDRVSGVWTVRFYMYVFGGSTGFWNIQESEIPGVQWNGQFFAGATGSGGSPGVVTHDDTGNTAPYPDDQWFEVKHEIDLDAGTHSVWIDGNVLLDNEPYQGTGGAPANALGSVNYFSIDGSNNYFIDDFEFVEGTLSTNDFEGQSFKVYPNPVKDVLNIQSNEAVSNVAVYNVLGQKVYSNNPNAISPTVNMSTFKSGIYFVEVTIGNTTKTVKVVK
ncbi:MAG: T9SS type A sorting domain-containing protein [Flavobacteriaceae bacterium]